MGLLLNQFRDDLRRDYLSNGWRDSFLFRYLKQEREEQKGQEKKDSYSQLERAFSNIHSEDGRRAYFLLALGLLEKSRKPLLPGNGKKGQKDGKALLLDYARDTRAPEFLGTKRWDRKTCRLLLDLLERNSAYPIPDAGWLQLLHRELTDGLLRREAEDYLYNLENDRKNSRDMAILEAYLDRSSGGSHKDDDGISPGLSQFYAKSGSGRAKRVWNEEKIAQLQRFYENLCGERYKGALVPICIEPLTGAGLYFIGNDFFQGTRLKNTKGACLIACLYTNDLCLSPGEYGTMAWSVWGGDEDELEELCGYPNVAEALKWFEDLVKGGGRAGKNTSAVDFLEYFQDGNGAPPPTCPPELLRYFLPALRAVAPLADKKALAGEGQEAWLREGGDRGQPVIPAKR